MRHGIAEERESFVKKNLEDHLRPLTLKGRKRVQMVSMQLRDWIDEVELIVTSPFVRARQTAELAAQIFLDSKIVEAAELVPSSPPQAFKRWLHGHGDEHDRIIAIGHEPQLSVLATFLMTSQVEPILDIKKGGILSLHIPSFKTVAPGTAKLNWLIQPKHIID